MCKVWIKTIVWSKVRSEVKISDHGERVRILGWKFRSVIDNSRVLKCHVGDTRKVIVMISAKLKTTKTVQMDRFVSTSQIDLTYTSSDSSRVRVMPGANESEWGVKELVLLVELVVMLVADSVADSLVQIFPDEPVNMSSLSAFEVSHLPHSACEKDDAL